MSGWLAVDCSRWRVVPSAPDQTVEDVIAVQMIWLTAWRFPCGSLVRVSPRALFLMA